MQTQKPAWLLLVGASLLGACVPHTRAGGPQPPGPLPPAAPAADPLAAIFSSHPGLQAVVDDAPRYRFQAVLGVVEERPGGRPVLVQHTFRADEEYLYPASTVKLFAAVAALETLAALRRDTGLAIDADTPLVFHPLFPGELRDDTDPTNLVNGRFTVRHEIRKLFLVSDNEAFNRLYELVGPDGIAASLARAGVTGGRIVHRLSEVRSAAENRRLPRIDFVGAGFTHRLPERTAAPLPPAPPAPGLGIGDAYLDGESRVEGPMDFTAKNRFPLGALQRGLCMVVRPDVDCGGPGFALDAGDRDILVEAMGQLPRESANPVYDPADHPDASAKWLLPGVLRVVPPERVRIHDKSGQAYGFTLDNAWVVDTGTARSFFLAAALYTNDDGVLNDDLYDYETVALPFFADLGEAAARALLQP